MDLVVGRVAKAHGITREIWHLVRASKAFLEGEPAIRSSEAVYRELLEMIETVPAHMPGGDASLLRVFVRDLDEFLAALLVH